MGYSKKKIYVTNTLSIQNLHNISKVFQIFVNIPEKFTKNSYQITENLYHSFDGEFMLHTGCLNERATK